MLEIHLNDGVTNKGESRVTPLKRSPTAYNMRIGVRSGRQLISSYDSSGVPALTHYGLTIKPILLKINCVPFARNVAYPPTLAAIVVLIKQTIFTSFYNEYLLSGIKNG